ncbi:hypothetical protein MBLNU230_g5314t1 [Neophaeotheca triangularis]
MGRIRFTRSFFAARPGTIDNRGEGEWTTITHNDATPNSATDGTNEHETLLHSTNAHQNSYGATIPNSLDEEAAHQKSLALSRLARLKTHLNTSITPSWTDLILVTCFFIAGLVDSGAYNAYETFTSMQTGNTVFAALGVSDLPVSAPKGAYLKSLTSIFSFIAGAMLFGTAHRYFGGRKRWVLMCSFGLQAAAVIVAAEMVRVGKSSDSPVKRPSLLLMGREGEDFPGFPLIDLVPIGLLSFQASGKVTLSRVVGFTALPAVVLTTLFNDLASDPFLTAGLFSNVQRNRRAGSVAMYLGGAILGGWFARSQFGFVGALWTSAIVQFVIMILWVFWKEEQQAVK